MRIRRLARVGIIAVAALTALTVGLGTPASAATHSILTGTVTSSDLDVSAVGYPITDCAWNTYPRPIQAVIYTMTASTTGTYSLDATMNPAGKVYMSQFLGAYSASDCLGSFGVSGTMDLTAGTEYLFAVWLCPDADCTYDFTGSFEIDAAGPGTIQWSGGRVATADVPIPPWVQGYGRATAADGCLDGWAPSWEQWPNAGAGGWVCTRSIPSIG